MLLTTSSLLCIYHSTFGTLGDWKIILVSNLWLSRHLFFRILCTGTMCTTRMNQMPYAVMAPWSGLKWNLRRWLVKYCSSGQYFDAPSQTAILAVSMGGDNNNNTANLPFRSSFSNSFPHNCILMPILKFYFWIKSIKHTNSKNENLLSNLFNFKSQKKSKKQNKNDNSVDLKSNNNHSNSRRNKTKSFNMNSSNNGRSSNDQNLQQILSSKQYKQLELFWENLPPPQFTMALISGIICMTAIVMFHPNTFITNIQSINHFNSQDHAFVSNDNANFNRLHNNDPLRSNNPHDKHTANDHGGLESGDKLGHSKHLFNHQNPRAGKVNLNFNYPTNPNASSNIATYMKSYAKPSDNFFSDPFNLHSSEPTVLKLFIFMASCGTLCSLISYGRMILPIPDLTASVRTKEKAKQLLKSNQSQSSHSRYQDGGASASNNSAIGSALSFFFMPFNSKNMNSSSKKKDKDIPWAERFKSIRHENKLVMIFNIMLLRIIENIVVCAILPHTFMVCQITNHCDQYPLLWERAGSFAIDSWRVAGKHGIGKDATIMTSFESIEVDSLLKFLIVVSAVFITVSLLLAQSVTLDRAHLSTLGLLSREFTTTDPNHLDSNDKDVPGSNTNTEKKLNNNSSRRQKKSGNGNHIGQNNGNFYNRNAEKDLIRTRHINEGKQMNYLLKSAHFLFQHELGNPSTSTIISWASIIHFLFVVCLINILMYYRAMGFDYLVLTMLLFANMTAIYGMCTIGIMDYREMKMLSEEISS